MTKEEIIKMAKQSGFERLGHTAEDWVCHLEDIEEFIKLVADKEREACAKLCDGLADIHAKMNQWDSHKTAETLAQAIRAGAIHD